MGSLIDKIWPSRYTLTRAFCIIGRKSHYSSHEQATLSLLLVFYYPVWNNYIWKRNQSFIDKMWTSRLKQIERLVSRANKTIVACIISNFEMQLVLKTLLVLTFSIWKNQIWKCGCLYRQDATELNPQSQNHCCSG